MFSFVVMLAAGVGLAAWNIWQRLGRSPAARSWARSGHGGWKHRSVLVVRPLIAVVLVLGAVVVAVDGSATATVVVGLAIAGCLLLLAAYLVLPLPVPSVTQPAWYRRTARGR